MALSSQEKSNITFKKYITNTGTTSDQKEFFLEQEGSKFSINLDQIQFDAGLIPISSGLTVDGEQFVIGDQPIVEYKVRAKLDKIPGTNAFKNNNINNIINPFKFGSNYNYKFENSNNDLINIYDNLFNGYFDNDNGILVFLGSLPPGVNTEIFITCYKYVGRTGTELFSLGNKLDPKSDLGSVKRVIDSITESSILATTGSINDRYLILEQSNLNNNNILYWNTITNQWDYIQFSLFKEGYSIFIDNDPSSIYRKQSTIWSIVSFTKTLPAIVNKNMPANITSTDLSLACGSLILLQPVNNTYVQVIVNGEVIRLANGYNQTTNLDIDDKEFDAAFGYFTTNYSVINTPGQNQIEIDSNDFNSINTVIGDWILLFDGTTEYYRRVLSTSNNIISYSGSNINSITIVSKFIFRKYGKVEIGDSLRWFPSNSNFNLDMSDWLDYNYVVDL